MTHRSNHWLLLSILGAVGIGMILTTGCIGIVTEQDLIPYRLGNLVYVDAAPHLFHCGFAPEIDVIYVNLGGNQRTIYVNTFIPNRDYYQFGILSPQSQKVHAIVDVLYVNGTTIRIFEGDV